MALRSASVPSSQPSRWSRPCTTRKRTSSAGVVPNSGACSMARCTETTTSPPRSGPVGSSETGKLMTSVGVSIPMNSRCSACRWALSVSTTAIAHSPFAPSRRKTNGTSRSISAGVTPAGSGTSTTTSVSTASVIAGCPFRRSSLPAELRPRRLAQALALGAAGRALHQHGHHLAQILRSLGIGLGDHGRDERLQLLIRERGRQVALHDAQLRLLVRGQLRPVGRLVLRDRVGELLLETAQDRHLVLRRQRAAALDLHVLYGGEDEADRVARRRIPLPHRRLQVGFQALSERVVHGCVLRTSRQ